MKKLGIFGVIAALAMIVYGRSNNSDIRIVGYILIMPAILAFWRGHQRQKAQDCACDGESDGTRPPKSGEALPSPSGDGKSDQDTLVTGDSVGAWGVPFNGGVSFGASAGGGKKIATTRSPVTLGGGKSYKSGMLKRSL